MGKNEAEYKYYKEEEAKAWQKYKLARLKFLMELEKAIGYLADGIRGEPKI